MSRTHPPVNKQPVMLLLVGGLVMALLLPSLLSILHQLHPSTSAAISYPPDQNGLQSATVQSVSRPGYLQTVTDPTFGGQVTRISDQAAYSTSKQYIEHNYAKVAAWNADGSMLLLDGDYWGSGWFADGTSYAFLRQVNLPNGNHSARWSNVNPDNLYGVTSGTVSGCSQTENKFVVIHPKSDTKSTPTQTVLHTFAEFDACAGMSFGLEEGNFSNDDSLGSVIGWSSTHSSWGLTTFSMANTLTATPTVTEIATYWFGSAGGTSNDPDTAGWNNITVAPKGDGVLMQWNTEGTGLHQGVEWYNPQLSTVRHIAATYDHWDVGLDANGNELAVLTCDQPGGASTNKCDGVSQSGGAPFLAAYYLDGNGPTGQTVNLYPQGYPNLTESIHVSCRNQFARPGWCYISDMQNNPSAPIGYEQIYALKLDGSHTVEVFGVDHGSNNTCSSCNEYAAKGVPNRDGSKVLFTSDWGLGASSPAYDYVASWPQPAASSIPGDCDNDSHVTITDLSILLSHYMSAYPACDFNNDGTVNIYDLSTLLTNYGT